tara:strand:+ start:315 stop:1103 length:789 start_codon:yes stop_codon:yes gene_type:complete
MNLSWRFSGGILFSLTFHAVLISALFYAYPGLINKGGWILEELPLLSAQKMYESVSSIENEDKSLDIKSIEKIIFPDLVTIRILKKHLDPMKKNVVLKPKYTLKSILNQLERFPERINVEIFSNKQLSKPVVSLVSLLPPVSKQNKFHGSSLFFNADDQNNIRSFESNELKNYLNRISKFLSEGWEVPIHLKESKVTVSMMFEINKNGKILDWELENSGSTALNNSVNNLMKNLQSLPALPQSYQENSYIFGVRFSPTIPQK